VQDAEALQHADAALAATFRFAVFGRGTGSWDECCVRARATQPKTIQDNEIGAESRDFLEASPILALASCPELPEVIFEWSGRWESNPRLKLGKLGYYHYTTPARRSILFGFTPDKQLSIREHAPGIPLRGAADASAWIAFRRIGDSVLHDEAYVFEPLDVCQRIALYGNDVGEFAGLDAADAIGPA
jgi:hypothetical protein